MISQSGAALAASASYCVQQRELFIIRHSVLHAEHIVRNQHLQSFQSSTIGKPCCGGHMLHLQHMLPGAAAANTYAAGQTLVAFGLSPVW